MKIIKNLRKPISKGSVLTIGVFDGVHLGHKDIIDRTVRRAKALGLDSVALTFDPHPARALRHASGVSSLISLGHRINLIGNLGVDLIVVLNFTKHISSMSAEEFVKNILVDKLRAKEVHVGEGFRFGRGAASGVNTLRKLAAKYGFALREAKSVKINGRVVSSSLIRRFIGRGDINTASRFLGRSVAVFGTVVSGASLAKQLGYPTANLNPHHEVIPPAGVYAVLVKYMGRMFKGVLNIGLRPTFYSPRDEEPAIEVHIFDFAKKIYGKGLEVFFVKKIRDEVKFKDKDALVSQIQKDEKVARCILSPDMLSLKHEQKGGQYKIF